ncbi:MAG TPA: PorP/SprF family type IX secretion system membrane protein [Saprospiraceae bacterium]|nr:PorP/SprF family type IX secretion system membrane protein [Saprospiraceae bacterium]
MNQKLSSYFFSLILACLFTTLGTNQLHAQEAGYFSHYYFEPVLINPGATGFQGDHQILAGYKHNYSDFDGAPRTLTALYQGSFADKIGLGIQLMSDKIGVSQLFEGQLSYAYRFSFSDAVISLGFSTGLQTYKIKDIHNDAFLNLDDELLNDVADGIVLFDGSAGLYGEVDKKLFFGVSFPNLIKNRLTKIQGDINLPKFDVFSYAVQVGYRFNVKNYNFQVEPSITVKDLRYSTFLIDANVKLSFLDEQLVGGLGYSLGDEGANKASLLLGTRVNALRFYYSYDVSLGDFQKYNNGSHELTLVYRIPAKVSQPVAPMPQ